MRTNDGRLVPQAKRSPERGRRRDPDPAALVRACLTPSPRLLGPGAVLGLQRLVGNAAVCQLLRTQAAKEERSPVKDVPSRLSQNGPGEAFLATKAQVASRLSSILRQPASWGGGQALDAGTRSMMESSLGHAFSDVRIHTGARAAAAARSVGASAYTVGADVVLAGAYDPASPTTQRTLAHELTQVVQQRSGPIDGTPAPGGIRLSDPSCRYEQAAETVADHVMSSLQRISRQTQATASSQSFGWTTSISSPRERGRAVQRAPQSTAVGGLTVQRHSSWEHRLIGDIPPGSLFKLGAHEDLANAQADTVAVGPNQEQVTKADINHLILQEIHRLRVWQTNPPAVTGASGLAQATTALEHRAAQHPTLNDQWGVRLVMIPAAGPKDTPLVLTYGELNTLADFYGSVDELQRAKPDRRRAIVQGVRKESYKQLLKVYRALNDVSKKQAEKDVGGKLKFKGKVTQGGGARGFIKLTSRNRTGAQNARDKYGSVVARNACHFAPESWHAWESYHRRAIELAQVSKLARDNGQVLLADTKLNEALLHNGFGDHYLQDSYASGHLINKTQIMQWYVEFLDKTKNVVIKKAWEQDYRTWTRDTAWRQRQAIAYRQGGLADANQYQKGQIGTRPIGNMPVPTARNPQAVEDTTSLGNAFGWRNRFEMLGLRTPPSVQAGSPALHLLLWMQQEQGSVAKSRYDVRWRWASLKDKTHKGEIPRIPDVQSLQNGMTALLDDAVVFSATQTNRGMGARLKVGAQQNFFKDDRVFELRKEWVVSVFNKKDKFAAAAGAATSAQAPDMDPYEKMMQATVHKDYTAFMEDALIQKGANELHDHFCKEGLMVGAGNGATLFKIYGDQKMLAEGSSAGLRESATTANQSRDSIMYVAQHGQEPQGMATADLLRRLPDHVRDHQNNTVSLETWHTDPTKLKAYAEANVFPNVSAAQSFLGGTAGAPGARKVPFTSGGKLGKSTQRHGAEAF